jgi:hypothetical protein
MQLPFRHDRFDPEAIAGAIETVEAPVT